MCYRTITALFLTLLLFAGCDGSSGGNDSILLEGTALLPPGIGESEAAREAPFEVWDLRKPQAQRVIAEGITDGEGRYSVRISRALAVAVVVFADVRVSGLIDTSEETAPDSALFSKTFEMKTDLACEAGVTALDEEALDVRALNALRIANLEKAAEIVLAEGGVDFTNPASVSAAALRVREISGDGELAL